MSIISITILAIITGMAFWINNHYIPLDSRIKSILNFVIFLYLVLWVLDSFGIITGLVAFITN